ncbi:MAG: hypothetical protein HQL61_07780 [Magnetococcales bacterium]|nr:hypothetical protein [Nitrospirota bacterium]
MKNVKVGQGDWDTFSCLFHNDKHNSAGYHKPTHRWVCLAGCGKGDFFDLIANSTGQSFKDILLDLGAKLGIQEPQSGPPPITQETVDQLVAGLNVNDTIKRYLTDTRGLSNETIKQYQIGYDPKRQRISIPVSDHNGKVVNIRLYNADKDPKIVNYTEGAWKYGSPARLYGLPEMLTSQSKHVIICEGEWDRLLLVQHGFTAVTGTAGAGTFPPEWATRFKNKDVVIIYDCDASGQIAVNNIVIKALTNANVASIKNIVLPLKGTKDDKDITDWFVSRKRTAADLRKLIDETPVYVKEAPVTENEPAMEIDSFTEITKKEYVDKKISCKVTIYGETNEGFHAAEEFKVMHCPKTLKGECFECNDPITVHRNSYVYIGSCMSTNLQVTAMLRDVCCKYGQKPHIEITKKATVQEFFCHQKISRYTLTSENDKPLIDNQRQELMEVKVYYLSSDTIKPGIYLAEGYVKSHPKTQQITCLFDSLVPIEEDYQAFKVEENIEHLRAFQMLTTPDIIEDLTRNVIKIYERDEILLTFLLTYCSPLRIRFADEVIRGWMIAAIVGDAGTGKTQTYNRISEYINVGDCFSGLTGSRTGLAYSLEDHPLKGWTVKIGRYPANSRKILVIDEAHKISPEDMRTLSKAMEEGWLMIDRIKSRGYESMTRMVFICNPSNDNTMDTYTWGCQTLADIFTPPTIRRIDFAVFANAADIPYEKLSMQNRGSGVARVTPEMLRSIVYWAWNLKVDQIVFEEDAESLCRDEAAKLIELFSHASDIPLITASDCEKTVARIATAFAVLSVSANEDFTQLIVKQEHIDLAGRFLMMIYAHDNCALDSYSTNQRKIAYLDNYDEIKTVFEDKTKNKKHISKGDNYFEKIIDALVNYDAIRRDDLTEKVGCSVELINKTIKMLKKFDMIRSDKDGYKKEPKFNRFIRRFIGEHPEFKKEMDCSVYSTGEGQ